MWHVTIKPDIIDLIGISSVGFIGFCALIFFSLLPGNLLLCISSLIFLMISGLVVSAGWVGMVIHERKTYPHSDRKSNRPSLFRGF
jgi:hypothetical protein